MSKDEKRLLALIGTYIALLAAIFYTWHISDENNATEIKTHITTINNLRTIIEKQEQTIKSMEENRDIVEITEVKPDGSKKITKTDKTKIISKEDTKKEEQNRSELTQVQDFKQESKSDPNMLFIGLGTDVRLNKNIHIQYKKKNLLYQIYGSGLDNLGGSISIGF